MYVELGGKFRRGGGGGMYMCFRDGGALYVLPRCNGGYDLCGGYSTIPVVRYVCMYVYMCCG